MSEQTAVYVVRAVDDNRVLYVGMTENPQVRFAHHRRYSPWWSLTNLALIELTWYPTREMAADIELRSIAHLKPEFNKAGAEGFKPGRAKWSPPDAGTEAAISGVLDAFAEWSAAEAEYKRQLTALVDGEGEWKVPISHLAERLEIERKTVYRHTGRSMT